MVYTSVAKIANIRLKLHKVLPAVYDESLSYLEGLAKLTFKVNEAIDGVNALNDNVEVLNDSVTELNNRVTAVEGEIDGFEREVIARVDALEIELKKNIDDAVSEMEAEVDAKLDSVDDAISNLDRRVTELEQYVQQTLDNLIAEVRELIQDEIDKIEFMYSKLEVEMRKYVDDAINQLIIDIPDLTTINVIDPTTGKLVKVQEAINNILIFNLTNALTVDEINAIGYTCNEWNTVMVNSVPRGMRIREWLHDAKKILIDKVDISIFKNWVHPHAIVRNYLTGTEDWLHKNVDINEKMWAWSGCFTANEIVTNNFTVDQLNEFGLTCEEYVLKANVLMISA